MIITIILIVITGLISYAAFSDRNLKAKLLMHPQSVNEFGQYYRFLTSGFVHADMRHLGINMFVLYMFGQYIETGFYYNQYGELVSFNSIFGETMGKINYLILYFGSIIAGSIPSFLKHKDHGWYSALGASGGTSGVLFAVIIFQPWSWLLFPPVPFIVFGIGYVVYSSYMAKNGKDNIGHDAHLWGGLFGFFYTAIAVYLKDPQIMNEAIERMLSPSFL